MAFALVVIGIVILTAAVRGTHSQLAQLVKGDFTGPNNFIYWMLAILIIGAIGYIPKAKPFSIALLSLVIIVLVLQRGNPNNPGGGFFQQFSAAIGTTQTAQASSAVGSNTTISPGFAESAPGNTPFGLPNLSTILPHL